MNEEEMIAALSAPRKWDKDDPVEQARSQASTVLMMRFLKAFENIAFFLENINSNISQRQ